MEKLVYSACAVGWVEQYDVRNILWTETCWIIGGLLWQIYNTLAVYQLGFIKKLAKIRSSENFSFAQVPKSFAMLNHHWAGNIKERLRAAFVTEAKPLLQRTFDFLHAIWCVAVDRS